MAKVRVDRRVMRLATIGKDKAMATQKEATLRLYQALSHPAKAGRVWVQYPRATIDAALDVLKQIMVAHGYEFRPADTLPADRECCGTAPGSAHRSTCEHYRARKTHNDKAKGREHSERPA